MRFQLECASGYNDEGETLFDSDIAVEAVSDGEVEPLSLRLYVAGAQVGIFDVDELERVIAYAKSEKAAIDAGRANGA